MTRPVHDKWKEFEAQCVPEDASLLQREALRGAFYAGASNMWNYIGVLGTLDTDERERLGKAIFEDMADFCFAPPSRDESFRSN